MPTPFEMEIITPERRFFMGMIESLVVETTEGRLGIQRGHEPLVAALSSSRMEFKENNEWRVCYSSDGVMEVSPQRVFIMAQKMEWPEEVEENRIREEKARAEADKRQAESQQEFHQSMAMLSRAMVNLRKKRSINIE